MGRLTGALWLGRRRGPAPGLYPAENGPGQVFVAPRIDKLPGHCGLDVNLDTETRRVQWRAVRGLEGEPQEFSPWSPWYDVDNLPGTIRWRDLWR